jgi:phospholipase C
MALLTTPGPPNPNGTAGGPAYDNGSESGLSWETYAETLQKAGITWKVYQSYDNYGDNALEYFSQFQDVSPGSALYPGVEEVPGSSSGSGDIAQLIAGGITADLEAGTFPQVSWIVTNQAYSEHPYAAPNDGAHCVNLVLNALAAYPSVFNSTAVFLSYDENDGLFDHVPPPVPELGTADEYIPSANSAVENLPIGLGFRVPMTIISPWTRGGNVFSEVSDHTSVIQFVEQWSTVIGKPAICPNISAWRREVCSDLVGAFNFASPVTGLPSGLPSTSSTSTYGMTFCAVMLNPSPTTNSLPAQEAGTRTALALPYQPTADITGFGASATSDVAASIELASAGNWAKAAAHFWIFANSGNPDGPWPYTVSAGATWSADLTSSLASGGWHDFTVTVSSDSSWSRRYTGHLENGLPSITC